jgi:putative ABC transport system permease protein
VVLGSIIYFVVYQVVIALGMNGDDMKLITAMIVAVFLALPFWKAKYFSKPVKLGGDHHA